MAVTIIGSGGGMLWLVTVLLLLALGLAGALHAAVRRDPASIAPARTRRTGATAARLLPSGLPAARRR